MKGQGETIVPGKAANTKRKNRTIFKADGRDGHPPLPTYIPLARMMGITRIQFVPGPNHNFLNSTFSNNQKHMSRLKKKNRTCT